jgi:protein TonB
MSVEEKRNSTEQIGTLGSCLIEGDSEQKARERKTKRRALIISIALQSLAIVAIAMVPLLGHTEKIGFRGAIPMPPYRPMPNRPVGDTHPRGPQPPRVCITCIHDVSPIAVSHDNTPLTPTPRIDDTFPIGDSSPDGFIPMIGTPSGPKPPEDPDKNKKRRITVGGDVQGAMLIRRVEPSYPPLARQLRRSGLVHIRALISTEGNIESLQVLDGDPLLVQSARDAVLQWHYRPTSLNGVPVEVETIITVVYTLNP